MDGDWHTLGRNVSQHSEELRSAALRLNFVIEQLGASMGAIPAMKPVRGLDMAELVPEITKRSEDLARLAIRLRGRRLIGG